MGSLQISFLHSCFGDFSKLHWPVKPTFIAILLLLTSCTSNQEYGPDAQIFYDMSKCTEPKNQSLPACYCHRAALMRYPDRIDSCLEPEMVSSQDESDYQAGSCVMPDVSFEGLDSLAERKALFCQQPENWELSSCYCYEPVVRANPDRRNFCTTVARDYQIDELTPYQQRTTDWLSALRQQIYPPATSGRYETDTGEHPTNEHVFDPCNEVDRLLELAFVSGGFEMFELAKILVDTNLNDDIYADYYVGAIWVSGEWFYLEAGSENVQSLGYLEFGGVKDPEGKIIPAKIMAYRPLDHAHWHLGKPPALNIADNFCPVEPALLLPQ